MNELNKVKCKTEYEDELKNRWERISRDTVKETENEGSIFKEVAGEVCS